MSLCGLATSYQCNSLFPIITVKTQRSSKTTGRPLEFLEHSCRSCSSGLKASQSTHHTTERAQAADVTPVAASQQRDNTTPERNADAISPAVRVEQSVAEPQPQDASTHSSRAQSSELSVKALQVSPLECTSGSLCSGSHFEQVAGCQCCMCLNSL